MGIPVRKRGAAFKITEEDQGYSAKHSFGKDRLFFKIKCKTSGCFNMTKMSHGYCSRCGRTGIKRTRENRKW